jgi:hypothetical protein
MSKELGCKKEGSNQSAEVIRNAKYMGTVVTNEDTAGEFVEQTGSEKLRAKPQLEHNVSEIMSKELECNEEGSNQSAEVIRNAKYMGTVVTNEGTAGEFVEQTGSETLRAKPQLEHKVSEILSKELGCNEEGSNQSAEVTRNAKYMGTVVTNEDTACEFVEQTGSETLTATPWYNGKAYVWLVTEHEHNVSEIMSKGIGCIENSSNESAKSVIIVKNRGRVVTNEDTAGEFVEQTGSEPLAATPWFNGKAYVWLVTEHERNVSEIMSKGIGCSEKGSNESAKSVIIVKNRGTVVTNEDTAGEFVEQTGSETLRAKPQLEHIVSEILSKELGCNEEGSNQSAKVTRNAKYMGTVVTSEDTACEFVEQTGSETLTATPWFNRKAYVWLVTEHEHSVSEIMSKGLRCSENGSNASAKSVIIVKNRGTVVTNEDTAGEFVEQTGGETLRAKPQLEHIVSEILSKELGCNEEGSNQSAEVTRNAKYMGTVVTSEDTACEFVEQTGSDTLTAKLQFSGKTYVRQRRPIFGTAKEDHLQPFSVEQAGSLKW